MVPDQIIAQNNIQRQQYDNNMRQNETVQRKRQLIVAIITIVAGICFNYTVLLQQYHNSDFRRLSVDYNNLISEILEHPNQYRVTTTPREGGGGTQNQSSSSSLMTDEDQDVTSSEFSSFWSQETSPAHQAEHNIVEFERQEGVVIATKLHGIHQLFIMEQSLCLLHYAYNNRVNYDVIAFTTDPINDTLLEPLRASIAPAKFTLVVDNRGLQEEIRALSPIRRTKFLERCHVSSPENLTWWSECPGRVAYNWQAEFRAWHIWKHPALQPYKYMMWLDTDAFPTQKWDRDPVAVMMQNKLFMLFDNFPQGRNTGEEIQNRIVKSFNKTLCGISLKNGTLHSSVGGDCSRAKVPLIHGFFHITDLDFYRSDIVQRFAENWIGDCFLCREYDDQAGVTIPVAMLAPERAWDMRSHGIHLNVFHNFHFDGKEKVRPKPSFLKFWERDGNRTFPEAWGKCPVKAGT